MEVRLYVIVTWLELIKINEIALDYFCRFAQKKCSARKGEKKVIKGWGLDAGNV